MPGVDPARTSTVLRALVGAAALYVTYSFLVSTRKTLLKITHADPSYVILATVCEATWYASCVEGWRTTFEPVAEHPPPRGTLFALYNIKLAVDQISGPLRVVSGNAARLYYAVKLGHPITEVLPTVIADVVLRNLSCAAVLGAVAAVLATDHRTLRDAIPPIAAGVPILASTWYAMTRENVCERLLERPLTKLAPAGVDLRGTAEPTAKILRSTAALRACLFHALGWVSRVARMYSLTYAIWPDANPSIPILLSLTIRASAAVAPTPAGLGVADGVTIGVMKLLGAPTPEVAAILVIDRVYAVLPPSILGAVYAWTLRRKN